MFTRFIRTAAVLAVAAVLFFAAGCDNPVVTEIIDSKVTSVTISASVGAASVGRGGVLEFNASVAGTGRYSTALTWSVKGANDSGTVIDGDGLLTVSPYETAETLTVTAVSGADSVQSNGVAVTVTIPTDTQSIFWHVSEAGNDFTGTGAADAPFKTVSKALETIKAAYVSSLWPGKAEGTPFPAYILIDGTVTGPGGAKGTVALSSANGSNEYPVIEIRGKDAEHPGTIQAGPLSRVLFIEYNKVILGPHLTLTGGAPNSKGYTNDAAIYGGGVYLSTGSHLTLMGAGITANSAEAGGGVYAVGGGIFNMVSGSISGNTAIENPNAAGGAVCLGNNGYFTMTGGTITGNRAENNSDAADNKKGGNGIYLEDWYGTVNGKLILGNGARITADNEVRLYKGASIILTGEFIGSEPIATVDLTTDTSSPAPVSDDWIGKSILKWDEGLSGPYPTGRFSLGSFQRGQEEPAAIAGTFRIDTTTGFLTKTGSSTVEDIAINAADPDLASVERGGKIKFTAAVTGTNSPPQTVAWTVTGNNDPATVIDEDGVLSVAAGETASSLTVTAASTFNPLQTDETSVAVHAPVGGKATWYVSAGPEGDDDNNGRTAATPVASLTRALDLIRIGYNINNSTGGAWPQENGRDAEAVIVVKGTIDVTRPLNNIEAAFCQIENSATSKTYPPLMIRGDSADNPGILQGGSGGNYHRVLSVNYNRVTLGRDLTLKGGATWSVGSAVIYGGVVYVKAYGELIIDGAAITGGTVNRNTIQGAGLGVMGKAVLRSGSITGNKITVTSPNAASTFGGGVGVTGEFVMEGGTIEGNTTTGDGGGVVVNGGVFIFAGGTIRGNKAGYDTDGNPVADSNKLGGGALLRNNGRFIFSGGSITGNLATRGHGQGVYMDALTTANATAASVFTIGNGSFGTGDDILVSNTVAAEKSSNLIILSEDFAPSGENPVAVISLLGKGTAAEKAYVTEWLGRRLFRWQLRTGDLPLSRFTLDKIYSNDFSESAAYESEWLVDPATGEVGN
jgi:hypothetical protein